MSFLCLEFVNSSWYITHKLFTDPLLDKEWRTRLTERWYSTRLPEPSAEELRELLQLRSLLTELFQKLIEGQRLSNTDIALINDCMSQSGFHRQLLDRGASYELVDIPEVRNWSWLLSEIAASFSRLYSSNAAARLKACQNPECRWLFVDDSKSGARKWCDDTCATLMKVRRFRQKQKKEHT